MKWTLCSSKKEGIENDDKNKDPERWRDLVAFWILGMCNNYGYVIMLSAAHDIIKSLDSDGNVSGFACQMFHDIDRIVSIEAFVT